MNESQEQFSQRLMAADPATPKFKTKYEKELHMLFSDRNIADIEGMHKRKLIVQATLLLAVGILAATPIVTGLGGSYVQSPLNRRLFSVIAVFMLAMGAYLVRILMRGKVNLGTYNAPLEVSAWIMNVILFGVFAFNALFNSSPINLALLGFGVGLLVFAGVQTMMQSMKRTELRTQEKLLKLEIQFAELTEKLQSKRD
jgi:hypothetical protein